MAEVRPYEVLGPYDLQVTKRKKGKATVRNMTRDDVSLFWNENDEIASRRGCYIFGMRNGPGQKPWYVGMTKNSFKQECLNDRNSRIINEIMVLRKGTPVLYFVVPYNKRKGNKRDVEQIETFLIQQAANKNPEIYNVVGKSKPVWCIDGVVRGRHGQNCAASKELRRMLKK